MRVSSMGLVMVLDYKAITFIFQDNTAHLIIRYQYHPLVPNIEVSMTLQVTGGQYVAPK